MLRDAVLHLSIPFLLFRHFVKLSSAPHSSLQVPSTSPTLQRLKALAHVLLSYALRPLQQVLSHKEGC
jgi:hypothetical protein